MNIAFITGGGDSAGINSAIARSILHGTTRYNDTFIGIEKAFEGLSSREIGKFIRPLGGENAASIFDSPSTILGSSRFAPFGEKNRSWAPGTIIENCRSRGIDAIIATGGNDTLSSALGVHGLGIPIIAVPKSIDNDISGTDWMLGANTAVDFAVKAFRSTAVSAETHARINVNEIMGRSAGWLAYLVGIGSGADVILVPEKSFTMDGLVARVGEIFERKGFVNIIAAEGTGFRLDDPLVARYAGAESPDRILAAMLAEKPEYDPHGNVKLGGAGMVLQRLLAHGMGLPLSSIRHSNIGFALRGLQPNAFDINLGQRFGRKAIDILHEGRSGLMTGIRGNAIVSVPLAEALPQCTLDTVDEAELRDFGVFFTPAAQSRYRNVS
jgi:ATP-dependent phosphofructokinase / diphosphate-dependent phosphofructokinase